MAPIGNRTSAYRVRNASACCSRTKASRSFRTYALSTSRVPPAGCMPRMSSSDVARVTSLSIARSLQPSGVTRTTTLAAHTKARDIALR